MDFHDLTSVLNRKMLGVALDEVHFALWFWFDLISDLNHRKKVVLFFVLLSLFAFQYCCFFLLGSMNLTLHPKLRKGKRNKIWNKISRLRLLAMRSMCSNLRSGICPIISTFLLFTFHFASLPLPHPSNLPPPSKNPDIRSRNSFPDSFSSPLIRTITQRASCQLVPIDQSCRSRASTLRVYTLNVQTAPLI